MWIKKACWSWLSGIGRLCIKHVFPSDYVQCPALISSPRPDISFTVFESSTNFTHATVADIIYVNKIIRKVKSSQCFVQFPKLDLNTVKFQLFTDTSFNSLPNGK